MICAGLGLHPNLILPTVDRCGRAPVLDSHKSMSTERNASFDLQFDPDADNRSGSELYLIVPTHEWPLYQSDTELREQSKVECAFRPDSSEHILGACNVKRASRDPAVLDSRP